MHSDWPEWILDDPTPPSPTVAQAAPVTTSTSEFDRFGPWIDEVTEPDDVPRLFRSYPIDFSATPLVLKVPRNISRRLATAGMDLYDHLVIVDQSLMTLLSRRIHPRRHTELEAGDWGFDAVALPLADVVAIKAVVNLLDGRLTVATSAGATIAFPFNGSAQGKVTMLVDRLREATSHRSATAAGVALTIAGKTVSGVTGVLDRRSVEPFLFSRFQELQEGNPELIPLASHSTVALRPRPAGVQSLVRHVAHAASPMTLYGALVAVDAGAVEWVGRHESLVRGRAPVYSSLRLVVPLGALDRVALEPHPVYAGATRVTLSAGVWSFQTAVPTESVAERVFRAAAEAANA